MATASGRLDARITNFYWQYLQQLEFDKLCFPNGSVLLEPMVQAQLHKSMFNDHIMWQYEGTAGNYLPSKQYQKRVIKEIVQRMEAAITDANEQEVSSALMEQLVVLTTTPDPPDPIAADRTKSVLSYTLPTSPTTSSNPNPDLNPPRTPITAFISEAPRLLGSDGGRTGQRTWPASLHLASYLATTPEGRAAIQGKSVLELGAGTGLVSILCAGPLGAAYVLATDGDTQTAEKTIPFNITINHSLGRHYGRSALPVEGRRLEWSAEADAGLAVVLPAKGGSLLYDTILGADLTYDEDLVGKLAGTIGGLVRLCPRAEVLIAAVVRNQDTFDLFLARCLERGLSVYDVDFRCPRLELQTGLFHSLEPEIRIVRIKREKRGR